MLRNDIGLPPTRRGRFERIAVTKVWAGSFAVVFLLAIVLMRGVPNAQARPAPDGFADLANRLLPAVVNISTTQTVEGIEMPVVPPGSPFEEFFKDFLEKNQPRQQRQRRATSLGSGFIIDASGYVITNNHVIQDADEITVILQDESRLEAKVVGRDPKTDLAVLKVNPTGKLTAVTFGDSDALRVGDWVIAIGNPFGFGGTVTAGIISARGRDINAGPYDDFLQTDASINRGNSGGPMFNLDGQVIGINTAIFSPTGASIGIGFAIPANGAKPVIDQLIKHGQVRRGWLGVRIQGVTEEIADTLGLKTTSGALVASVIPGGPAESSEIKAGDVILEFDGKAIDQMRRLPRVVAETEVGRAVDVKLWREGKEKKVQVTIGALDEGEDKVAAASPNKDGPKQAESIEGLGISVAGLDERVRERFSLDEEAKGVVVTEVDPSGPAAEQGIKAGEVILEVSQEEVSNPEQIAAKVKAARASGKRSILLLVEGPAGLRFIAVRLATG
jgi:serine protease Do